MQIVNIYIVLSLMEMSTRILSSLNTSIFYLFYVLYV